MTAQDHNKKEIETLHSEVYVARQLAATGHKPATLGLTSNAQFVAFCAEVLETAMNDSRMTLAYSGSIIWDNALQTVAKKHTV